MKKILNFRPIFVVFLGLVVGALFCPLVLSFKLPFLIAFCTMGAFCIVFCFFKKLCKVFLCFLLATIFSFGIATAYIKSYDNKFSSNVENAQIECVVTDKVTGDEGNQIAVVRNVKIGGKKRGGNLKVYLPDDVSVKAGDKLSFIGHIVGTQILNSGKINTYTLSSKINGYVFEISSLNIEGGKKTIFESIRVFSRQKLLSSIKNQDAAEFGYSVIFGDKTFLPNEVYNTFSSAGCAHLMAVSGLHVGLLAGIVLFVLKIFKSKRLTSFLTTSIFLLFYCFLCGFTPSVVRASVMIVCLMLAGVLGRNNDNLNALSLAGVSILMVKPLFVFSLSFVLSFACVFGIVCLSKPLNRIFAKLSMRKWLSVSLATVFSVNIATICFCLKNFTEFNYIALVSNLILIPIFSVFYYILFAFFVVSICLPFLSPILNLAGYIYAGLYYLASIFASVPVVVLTANSYLIILSLVLIFALSTLVVVSKKTKAVLCSVLALLTFSYAVVLNVPFKRNAQMFFVGDYGNCAVAIDQFGGEIACISSFSEGEILKVKKLCKRNGIKTPKTFFVANFLFKNEATIYANEFGVDIVYFNEGEMIKQCAGKQSEVVQSLTVGQIEICKFAVGSKIFAHIKNGEIDILIGRSISSVSEANFVKSKGVFEVCLLDYCSTKLSDYTFAQKIFAGNSGKNFVIDNGFDFCFKQNKNVIEYKEML